MSELTIAQKIEKELTGKSSAEIENLDLTGCSAESFEGLTEKFTGLKKLIASGIGLKSCDGLPPLKSLLVVNLANNKINDLKAVAALPNLRELDLSNNGIDNIEVIEQLYGSAKLESLHLEGNPIKSSVEGLMSTLFNEFPFLVSVDGINNPNGSTFCENGAYEDDEDDEDTDESEIDSEDDVGIDALQRSGELEDDEDDYQPGDDDDEEGFDDEEDDYEEDEDDQDDSHVEAKAGKKHKAEDADQGDAKRVSTNGADTNSD